MDETPMNGQRGLTLVETVVVLGIFMVLLGAVTSVFMAVTRGQQSAFAQATLLSDTQTFLELLEREVRTGFGNTFSGSGSTFAFKNQEGLDVTYGLDSQGTRIQRNGIDITGAALEIRSLDFSVVTPGTDPGPPAILTGEQGRVTVRMRACPRGIDDERCLVVQTTLTARQYGPI